MLFFKANVGLSLAALLTTFTLLDVYVPVSGNHPCYRKCTDKPRFCQYEFNIEWYYVLTKACYNCTKVASDCYRHHCVAGDGRQRTVMVANRSMPGPGINVCEDDTVEVRVNNMLTTSEGVSIHWHGVHQVGTPYMDGVASVTQCNVPTHSSFTYRFKASPAGTQFWHAHSGVQRADGLVGHFVIRQKNDPHASLYDEDLKEHQVLLWDWTRVPTIDKFVGHHHAGKDNKAWGVLINGRGQCDNCDGSGQRHLMPLETFNVKKGKRYRFRVVSNAYLNCPFAVSVQSHTMLLIASDGAPVEPVTVSSFMIQSGERYDFVLNANAIAGNYYFMVQGQLDCGENFSKARQAAVIHYEGAPTYDYKRTIPQWKDMIVKGTQMSAINVPETAENLYTSSLKALPGNDDELTKATPDKSFILFYDFNKISNPNFNDPAYYSLNAVEKKFRLYTPQLSQISMAFPPSPPLFQHADISESIYCNETSLAGKDCAKEFCQCAHRLVIKKGAVIDLILVDEGFTYDASHPFHIHGYLFRVMAMKKLGKSLPVSRVRELLRDGKLFETNPRAPLKDTVMVQDGGYTVIRFRANNPGVWFFHCHLEFHVEIGMGLLLQVGEPGDFPRVPARFPRCGGWKGIYENELSVEPSSRLSGAPHRTTGSALFVAVLIAACALHLLI